MNYQKLHLGCGLKTPDDWLNVDGSWNARLAKHPILRKIVRWTRMISPEQLAISWDSKIFIHDVRSPLPFETDSFQFVYASHLLEHLYWEEGQKLLKQCFRVLKPAGCLRIVVPDLKVIVEEYVAASLVNNDSKNRLMSKADQFNDRLLMHSRQPPSGNLLYRIHTALNDFHTHKWMYDADSLTQCFRMVGFTEVQEMACHASRISGIEAVEDPGRVLNGAGVCIEGIKPGMLGIRRE